MRPRCISVAFAANFLLGESFAPVSSSSLLSNARGAPSSPSVPPRVRCAQTAATTESLSFCFAKMVYIEDTDAYAIVYHGNYVKFMKRAIEKWAGPGEGPVHIQALDDMKFRQAAQLGEEIIVSGVLQLNEDGSVGGGGGGGGGETGGVIEGGCSKWSVTIASLGDEARVFASAVLYLSFAIGQPLPVRYMHMLSPGGNKVSTQDGKIRTPAITTLFNPLPAVYLDSPKRLSISPYYDEFGTDGRVLMTSVICYFERLRTLSLGKPAEGLKRLFDEGLSLVVTGLTDLRIDSEQIRPEEPLVVKTSYTAKPRRVQCYQSLWKDATADDGDGGDDGGDGGVLVAHAKVELLCMNANDKKFVSFPAAVLDLLNNNQ